MAPAVQDGNALRGMLSQTLTAKADRKDTRWEGGTESTSSFTKPPTSAYAHRWKPLPLSAAQEDAHGLATHLISRSSIFPRLHTNPEEVQNKLVPRLNEVVDACKAQDQAGSGLLTHEQLKAAVKSTGVFLTASELDQLVAMSPHEPAGSSNVNYMCMADVLVGKGTLSTTGLSTGRPPLPDTVAWPEDQGFEVTLRLRACEPYVVPGWRMVEFAKLATKLCRSEADAEKVHALLRTHMLNILVVAQPQLPGQPDLGFTRWLSKNSVFSLTTKNMPGPVPPEVYDILDQVIYEGLGIPKAVSATQVTTSLSSSLRGHMY